MALILIVDDSTDTLTLFTVLVRRWGHEPLSASTGEEAVAIADRNPDFILLDLGLPDISGYEVAERIRKKLPNAIIVAVTGHPETNQGDFDYHLMKPVDTDQMRLIIESVHRRSSAQ